MSRSVGVGVLAAVLVVEEGSGFVAKKPEGSLGLERVGVVDGVVGAFVWSS